MTDTYIDSRGAEMEPMSFSEALEIVHSLATGNQIDANDIAHGDSGLGAQRVWQQSALDAVHDLIVNHEDDLDELAPSPQAGEWPVETLRADRVIDPNQPINAIKIVLDMGEQGALDPKDAGRDVELADEIDRQQQALDVVRDLIGMHAAELEKIVVLDTSRLGA